VFDAALLVLSRSIGKRLAKFDDGGARLSDRGLFMAAEIMRGGFHISDRSFHFPNGRRDTRMINRFHPNNSLRRRWCYQSAESHKAERRSHNFSH
jgi:hypothetical protein